uniref:Odorant binding protein 35 n=2 Tax=Cylas formicarius TaxID=197179 RepID=A0A8T9EBT0_CYLFO|nr:odorant binding protein 35 [Cylas formicarius]
MKYIIVLAATLAYATGAPVYTQEILDVHFACQNITEYFVPQTVFAQLEFQKVPPSDVDIPDNFDDHMFCMYSGLGFESDSGELDLAVAADKLKTLFVDPNNSAAIVSECAAPTQGLQDPVEVAGIFYFCTLPLYA